MTIPSINAYKDTYNIDSVAKSINKNTQTKETTTSNQQTESNIVASSQDKILTQKERDFFIKMFPDNSEQIQNHVLFNRNGKIQNSNTYSKGIIFDGLA